MDEYIDMLIEGNHRLTVDEQYAAVNARRKRIALGREAIEVRKSMSKILGRHININLTEKGKIWE